MTENHSFPITPPTELVVQWIEEDENGPGMVSRIAARSAQWGADQELEACCEVVSHWYGDWVNGINLPIMLRAARRPEPPSLKEQALNGLEKVGNFTLDQLGGVSYFDEYKTYVDTIRHALEQLPDHK